MLKILSHQQNNVLRLPIRSRAVEWMEPVRAIIVCNHLGKLMSRHSYYIIMKKWHNIIKSLHYGFNYHQLQSGAIFYPPTFSLCHTAVSHPLITAQYGNYSVFNNFDRHNLELFPFHHVWYDQNTLRWGSARQQKGYE